MRRRGELNVFTGISLKNHRRKDVTLSRDVFEIDLVHLGYLPRRGWQIYPNVRATHEGW